MGKVDALPARPSLEFLKKLAKQQVVALRRQGKSTSLSAAQLTLARKYGFPSWRKLKTHVESLKQAAAAVEAISSGDTKSLKRLLSQNSSLANTRVDNERTLLHVATDWPGHFPNNIETIAALAAIPRLRSTGLRVAMTWEQSTFSSTMARTLRRGDPLSVAVRRCLTQWLLGNGKRRVDCSSVGRKPRSGRPLLWD